MTSPASAPFSGAARLADDTRRRFLATIVAHVPLERLVEVHLFPPIRQGGVETGVAVIAATPESAASGTAESTTAESETAESGRAEPASVEAAATACDPTEDAAIAPEPAVLDPAVPDAALPDAALPESAVPAPAPRLRHTVFTARYRVAIKGPDRGKWDADVVEEADAPLITVEAVVRGVQRRAGDTADPDRLGPDVVARILGVPNAPRAP